MQKMGNKYLLDDTDKRILAYLQTDGRRSYTEIGEKVFLSRVAVKARVQRMIDAGVIFKFSVVINRKKIAHTE